MERKVLGTCKVLRLLALKQNIFIPHVFSKKKKRRAGRYLTSWKTMSALSIKQSNSELSI